MVYITPIKMIFRLLQLLLFATWAINLIGCATINAAKRRPKVCDSKECKKYAIELYVKMNRSVNPCDNFHEFVCGNYVKNAVIPDDQSQTGLIAELTKKVQKELKTIFENDVKKEDGHALKTTKSYYNICMNNEQVEKSSVEEFLSLLKRLGSWPVLEGKTWNNSNFDWQESLLKLRKTGYSGNIFISLYIKPDSKNVSCKRITIDQASLGLSQEYLSQGAEQKIVRAYFKYMVDLAEILGANRTQAEKELKESLDFEIELAKISLSTKKRREPEALYNPMTVNELQAKYPYLSWLEYLNNYARPYAKIEPTENVTVSVPSFLKDLGKLIDKTPKRVLANYAFWRIVQESAETLREDIKMAQREFTSAIYGNNFKKARWQECVDHVKDRLYLSVGALYVKKHFSEKSKNDAMDMISNLRNAFRQMLVDVDWMEDVTKKQALDKLDNILPTVGYPDELLDDEALNGYYEDLKLNSKSFLRTMLAYNIFAANQEWKNLRKPALRVDWTQIDSATVNAFYQPLRNTITFPAGILQGAFFNTDHPKYLNYGAIGAVVGHEMTHGFDDQGRKYDKNGNLVDWWDPMTEDKYLKKADCIVKQYSNFTVKELGMNVDGVLTQGENIADNGGLGEAYKAYEVSQKENGEEPRLPGFESFTPKLMFWISYANSWCSKYRSEFLSNALITDVHSPEIFRIIGPTSNILEFANDFNCTVGSTMNPINKCSVW